MKRSEGLFHDEALRLKFKDRGRKRVGVMPKLWVAIAPLPNLATFGKRRILEGDYGDKSTRAVGFPPSNRVAQPLSKSTATAAGIRWSIPCPTPGLMDQVLPHLAAQ